MNKEATMYFIKGLEALCGGVVKATEHFRKGLYACQDDTPQYRDKPPSQEEDKHMDLQGKSVVTLEMLLSLSQNRVINLCRKQGCPEPFLVHKDYFHIQEGKRLNWTKAHQEKTTHLLWDVMCGIAQWPLCNQVPRECPLMGPIRKGNVRYAGFLGLKVYGYSLKLSAGRRKSIVLPATVDLLQQIQQEFGSDIFSNHPEFEELRTKFQNHPRAVTFQILQAMWVAHWLREDSK